MFESKTAALGNEWYDLAKAGPIARYRLVDLTLILRSGGVNDQKLFS